MIYIIAVAIVALFGPHLWAKHVLDKYNRQEYFSGTGIDLVRMVLVHLQLNDVTVEVTDTGDHYDPVGKTIRLTSKIMMGVPLLAALTRAPSVGMRSFWADLPLWVFRCWCTF